MSGQKRALRGLGDWSSDLQNLLSTGGSQFVPLVTAVKGGTVIGPGGFVSISNPPASRQPIAASQNSNLLIFGLLGVGLLLLSRN